MCVNCCLCNSCMKKDTCSDCSHIDTHGIEDWALCCANSGIETCDHYVSSKYLLGVADVTFTNMNTGEVFLKTDLVNNEYDITFKNGSTIGTIKTNGDSVRGKMHDFQYEDISEYIRYMKRNPYEFAELITGKKLSLWQRIYLDCKSILYSPDKKSAEKQIAKVLRKYKYK